jgi:hypothetical protein
VTENMKPPLKPPLKKVKPPTPRYHYSLATVTGSQQARRMENALREPLSEMGLSFFSIGHEDGSYDVMGDSGDSALNDGALRSARAVAAKIKKLS